MFTGIIESVGSITEMRREGTNLHLKITSAISPELKVDQSLSHDGICLTVVKTEGSGHWVTAIHETMSKTNLNYLHPGDVVNLERCLQMNGRFDGHIVQGHVDTTAEVISIEEQGGSWLFRFRLKIADEVMVEKGSVCINGVSLTCFDIAENEFSVAIIPYTFDHTNFKYLKKSSIVNVEYDIVGKYIKKLITKTGLK